MSSSESVKSTFYKKATNCLGLQNFIAWKKRTYLNLIENEVMDYIKGSVTKPSKEDTQAHRET